MVSPGIAVYDDVAVKDGDADDRDTFAAGMPLSVLNSVAEMDCAYVLNITTCPDAPKVETWTDTVWLPAASERTSSI